MITRNKFSLIIIYPYMINTRVQYFISKSCYIHTIHNLIINLRIQIKGIKYTNISNTYAYYTYIYVYTYYFLLAAFLAFLAFLTTAPLTAHSLTRNKASISIHI